MTRRGLMVGIVAMLCERSMLIRSNHPTRRSVYRT
jgi:hypothetical protein